MESKLLLHETRNMKSSDSFEGFPVIGMRHKAPLSAKERKRSASSLLLLRQDSRETLGQELPDIPGLVPYKEPSISSDSGIDPTGGTPGTTSQVSSVLPPIASSSSTDHSSTELTAAAAAAAKEGEKKPLLLIGSLRGHRDAVTQCHVLPAYIVTSSLDSTLRLWSRASLRFIVEFKCESPVRRFVCLPLDRFRRKLLLLAATDSGRLVAWKLKFRNGLRARCTNQFFLHSPNPIRALDVSADGRHLATGCCFRMLDILPGCGRRPGVRGTLKVWDLALIVRCAKHPKSYRQDVTHKRIKTAKELMRGSTRLSPPPPPKACAAAAAEAEAEAEADFGVCALVFSPDGMKLAVGFGCPDDEATDCSRSNRMIVICGVETLETLWIQDGVNYGIRELAFLPGIRNSLHLLVSTQRGLQNLLVSVVEDEDHPERVCLDVRPTWEQSFGEDHSGLSVSPDSRWVVSAFGSTATLRSVATGRTVESFTGRGPMLAVHFSDDGKTIVSTSRENTAELWTSHYTRLVESNSS